MTISEHNTTAVPASGLDADELAALTHVTEQILAAHVDWTATGLDVEFAPDLWDALESSGVTLLATLQAAGGEGAGLAASAAVLAACAAAAAPVPLAETDQLAGWLLGAAGLTAPDGPLTAATGSLRIDPSAATMTGRMDRVAWGRDATTVVVLVTPDDSVSEQVVATVSRADLEFQPGANLAREPRDTLLFSGARMLQSARVPATLGAEFDRRGALARAVALAAASERAIELTVRYVGEREQFGKPLARLQSVQQQLAEAAAEAAAAQAAVDAAVAIVEQDGANTARAEFAVAVAKGRSSAAAGLVARTAHQLHGAIGFTLEHPLRLLTTRLWAWRSEFGDETHWDAVVGRAVLTSEVDLWRTVTGLS